MKKVRDFSLSRPTVLTATLLGATFYFSGAVITSGDFEVPPPPSPTMSAIHAGVELFNNTVPSPTINGSELDGVDSLWSITFIEPWEHNVSEGRAVYAIFRGTIDGLDGGLPMNGINYSVVTGAIDEDTESVSFSLPPLGDPETLSGMYTIAVAEMPETKFVYDPVTDTFSEESYTAEDFVQWFITFEGGLSPINYRFLEFEYIAGEAVAKCCSSVAFIPGTKATELYEGNSKRWLPGLFNFDGQRLVMNSIGDSINTITVGKSIREVSVASVQVLEIYDKFFNLLDQLQSANTIAEWIELPYDWRYDAYTITASSQLLRDGSLLNLVDEIRTLAEDSYTGKVTLITHSNGGLVGKALIDALGDDAVLIDKFIMVGTPQLGTPSAIGAMLHGSGQGLPIDGAPLAMSKATAREVSENMPGAYGLLPLGGYFNIVSNSPIEFDDFPESANFRSAYGVTINTAAELQSFLLGIGDGRTKPAKENVLIPTILNQALLSEALATRNTLEQWVAPEGIEVVQIVGWGLDTPRTVRYYERCEPERGCFMDTKPVFTTEGDATVVYPSAAAIQTADTYFFNLHAFNATNGTTWTHANILAATSTQDLLIDIIGEVTPAAPFISTTKPAVTDVSKRLHISVHSPITLGIRDSRGRFTGVVPNPDPLSGIPVVRQEIPNAYYLEFGEGKYIGFNASEQYEIVMQGSGSGTFTLEVEEVENDTVRNAIAYSNIPVSTTTVAELRIQDLTNKSDLEIDENGDGKIDTLISPDSERISWKEFIALLKTHIQDLNINENLKKHLLKKVEQLEKKITKKLEKAEKSLAKLEKYIPKKKGISNSDISYLLELLKILESKL